MRLLGFQQGVQYRLFDVMSVSILVFECGVFMGDSTSTLPYDVRRFLNKHIYYYKKQHIRIGLPLHNICIDELIHKKQRGYNMHKFSQNYTSRNNNKQLRSLSFFLIITKTKIHNLCDQSKIFENCIHLRGTTTNNSPLKKTVKVILFCSFNNDDENHTVFDAFLQIMQQNKFFLSIR